MAVYYGAVKGNVVMLPDEVQLAEGTIVEVRITTQDGQAVSSEELVKQDLHKAGLLLELRSPTPLPSDVDRTPIQVKGKPLSEIVIDQRG
jgi:hypothetical protein